MSEDPQRELDAEREPGPRPGQRFPNLRTENLLGRSFSLPQDFEGELNLLLIAFYQRQQPIVDTWMELAADLSARFEDFRYYEIPVVGTGYRFFKGFIDSGMRRGIPDRAIRAATLTLYIDKESFRQALQIPDDSTVQVMLVDRNGEVYWRHRGPMVLRPEDLIALLEQRLG